MDRYPICYPITAKWEGGWSDHAQDPGGKTMYGITEKRWHEYQDVRGWKRTPVRSVTPAMAVVFYRSEYWEKCGAPNLIPGVDLAIFDVSVNSGVGRGVKYRNQTNSVSKPDERVRAICRARLSFLQSLKIWQTFGRGWGRRVDDIEARGVMMALEAMGRADEARKGAAIEAIQKAQAEQKKTSAQAKSAASATAVSTPAGAATSTFSDHTALYIIGGLVVIGIIAALVLYARQKAAQARADAYSSILGEQQ